ncbi:MAG TPA: hypothetical protein VGL97_04790 [Bryobacteraceae bacterium]
MKKNILVGCLAIAAIAAWGGSPEAPISPPSPELWYWHHSYLTSEDAVAKSEELIDKAAKAGYTGVVFWDSSFNFMGNPSWPKDNEDRMKEVMKYANHKHMKAVASVAPFGWSNDVLGVDPNWAESQRVVGAEFQVVASGKALHFMNSFPGLKNGDFEAGKTGWFDTNDQGIGITENAHGGKSAAAIVDAAGNGRLHQEIKLIPWRQYHLRLFFKSINFLGGPMVEIFESGNSEKLRMIAYPHANGTHDWTELDYSFNSGDTKDASLYLGVWGGSKGVLLFDDILLEERALVYVEHSAGAPFKLYDPANPAKVYQEGVDYNRVVDPPMVAPQVNAFHNSYHWPPDITLPAGTHLVPGQTVAADYYAVFPIAFNNETAMCMSEPGVYRWLAANAQAVKKVLPKEAATLLNYDEIRQANSCWACRSRKMTAGELLAWSVGKTAQIYQTALPGTDLYVWNDMFDPYHNAKDHVFHVEGDFAGSWKGLAADVSIMNWNLGALRQSLTWFSGHDPRQPIAHRQMIAGFYDRGNGAAEASKELKDAAGIPGVVGFMYTTYADDYSQLQSFADGARAAWPAYLASLPKR